MRMQQASQRQALRQSRASLDEQSNQQAQQDAQRLEPQIQSRERVPQHQALRQAPEQQAPHQQQASRPQRPALPRRASPPVSSPPKLSRPFPPLQLLQQPPSRGSACAPAQRASGQSNSSGSFFP